MLAGKVIEVRYEIQHQTVDAFVRARTCALMQHDCRVELVMYMIYSGAKQRT